MKKLLLAAAIVMVTSPAFAAQPWNNGKGKGPQGNNGNHGRPHASAPAPLLGAGLPALALIGGSLIGLRILTKRD